MPQLTLNRIRELIRSLNYVVYIHAAEELDDDNLTILDLENILLTGHIVERQRDRNTREVKIVVRGQTLDGFVGEAIVKAGHAGRLFVLTVYVV